MRSFLLNAVFRQHKDLLGILDRGKAVRNHECCTVFRQFFQGVLNHFFTLIVERRRRLIKDQYRRIFQKDRRCFCPPESLMPRCPMSVSYPCGNDMINSWALAFFAASMTSSLVASGLP